MTFDANMRLCRHFGCTQCGVIRDFRSEPFERLRMSNELQALGRVEKLWVEAKGLCPRCSKKDIGGDL